MTWEWAVHYRRVPRIRYVVAVAVRRHTLADPRAGWVPVVGVLDGRSVVVARCARADLEIVY